MYGSAAGVAALSNLWTRNGEFFDTELDVDGTRPSLTQVETWLDEVSSMMDVALANEGFSVPVDVVEVLPMIGQFVNGIVKDLADYSHGAGRFYTKDAIDAGLSPFLTVDREVTDWVTRKSTGLEALGCRRVTNGRHVISLDTL